MSAATPTSAIAIVARSSGAPRIAPIATSSAPSPPSMMAITGINDSGKAVATAASELAAGPLDRIREEQRACEKDDKARWQPDDGTQAETPHENASLAEENAFQPTGRSPTETQRSPRL
jgi:hypothetical protein